MAISPTSRADAYKRERERQKRTVGASGTSATAQARDARRNVTLVEMGVTTTTAASKATTAPKTTVATGASTDQPATKPSTSSGYTPTYGSNSLYTSAGNTVPSTPKPAANNAGYVSTYGNGKLYTGKGNPATSPKTPNGAATIHRGMSDDDIQLRQDYNKRREGQNAANQAKKDAYLQAMEEQTQANRNKRAQQLEDEIIDLTIQAAPIAQLATYENFQGFRQHDYFLQNQVQDAKTKLRELNGAGVVMSPDEIKARQKENNRLRKQAEEELWSMSDITADDLEGMSVEDYLAGAQANLNRTMALNADVTGAVKNNNAYDRMLDYQQRYYSDNASGQFKANRIDARLNQDINLAYSDYLDDPSQQNWEYVQNLSALQNQFRKNNTQTLDEDVVNPEMSLELARNIPGWWDGAKAAADGTVAGFGVSALTQGLVPPKKAMEISANMAEDAYNRNLVRGSTFRELVEMGMDKEIARKAANDEAIISMWIDATGNVFSAFQNDKHKDRASQRIPDAVFSNIEDAPDDMVKETLHAIIVQNAKDGRTDITAQELYKQAILETRFLQGFHKEY